MDSFSMVVGALVKTAYDGFCKHRDEKEKAVELQPISEAHCVGPLYSDNMEAIMDPDWMNKPRHQPGIAVRRIR